MHEPIAVNQPRLDALRLLVVDDSPDAIEALHVLLQFEGATVHVAHDGEAALTLLATHDVDLVLSDLDMPVLDGLGFVRALRRDARLRVLPVIALTGHDAEEDVQRALGAGFDTHLAKPVVLDQLVARILGQLGR